MNKTLEEQILDKIVEQGSTYEKENQSVPYSEVFNVLMHQSVYDAVHYIFEQEKQDQEFYIAQIFNNVSKKNKIKILEMEDIVDVVVSNFENFNHRDRFDIFGVSEDGWNSVYKIMNIVFEFYIGETE